ncbi:MAG TPA: chemotaxis protein CheW, partial [Solirubrobacteraceae bacterium]|nr:chemotaxis protein CheW [Solirubrobacteraceae bacterium]
MQALVLPVGADRYALELADVREVVRGPAITPLPGAPAAVLGALNLRGAVIPVLDTAALLGTGRLGGAPFAAVAET